MDQAVILPYVVLALGGAVGANVVGALMRGGGGVIGRTLIGVIAGAGAGMLALYIPQLGQMTLLWRDLLPDSPENSVHVGNLITGAIGGAIIGLVTGLLIRPAS